MNRSVLYILIGSVLLVGVLFWFLDSGSPSAGGKNYRNNWDGEYELQSYEPRGLGFFQQLVSSKTADTIYTADQPAHIWTIRRGENLNYYFIGRGMALSDSEYDSILVRVRKGSNLILSFEDISSNIYEKLLKASAYTWLYKDEVYIRSGKDSAMFATVFQKDSIYSDWYPFHRNVFIDSVKPVLQLGEFDVAVALQIGKGNVVLHAIPKLFENYQVHTKSGLFHSERMLNFFRKKTGSVFLEFADEKHFDPSGLDSGPGEDNSYLKYIMERPALRWAMILTILGILLYVIFRARRRQNVVPPVPEKRDMTLAFVDTLGTIYLSRNNPYGTLQVMKKNFYLTVNRFFYVDLQSGSRRELELQRLRMKSGYDEELLNEIIAGLEVQKADQVQVTNRALGELYAKIRRFYLHSGIIHPDADYKNAAYTIHRNLVPGTLLVLLGGMFIVRSLYLLALSGGIGIVILPLAIAVLAIGIRLLNLPAAIYSHNTLKVYRLFGKPSEMTIDHETHIHVTIKQTVFANPNGEKAVINHRLLGNNGKRELSSLAQQFKQFEA